MCSGISFVVLVRKTPTIGARIGSGTRWLDPALHNLQPCRLIQVVPCTPCLRPSVTDPATCGHPRTDHTMLREGVLWPDVRMPTGVRAGILVRFLPFSPHLLPRPHPPSSVRGAALPSSGGRLTSESTPISLPTLD